MSGLLSEIGSILKTWSGTTIVLGVEIIELFGGWLTDIFTGNKRIKLVLNNGQARRTPFTPHELFPFYIANSYLVKDFRPKPNLRVNKIKNATHNYLGMAKEPFCKAHFREHVNFKHDQ